MREQKENIYTLELSGDILVVYYFTLHQSIPHSKLRKLHFRYEEDKKTGK